MKNKAARLNDRFRQTVSFGEIQLSPQLSSLGEVERESLIEAIKLYDEFPSERDNPRDSGHIDFYGDQVTWKIEYFDSSLLNEGDPESEDTERRLVASFTYEL